MHHTSTERDTGGVSPHDLAAAQDIENIAQDVQTIPHGRAAGIRVYKFPDGPSFDSASANLHDAGGVVYDESPAGPVRVEIREGDAR